MQHNEKESNKLNDQILSETSELKGQINSIRALLRDSELTSEKDAFLFDGIAQILVASEEVYATAVAKTRIDRTLFIVQALIWESVRCATENQADNASMAEMRMAVHELKHACAAIRKVLQRRKDEGRDITTAA